MLTPQTGLELGSSDIRSRRPNSLCACHGLSPVVPLSQTEAGRTNGLVLMDRSTTVTARKQESVGTHQLLDDAQTGAGDLRGSTVDVSEIRETLSIKAASKDSLESR
jgi:hypothetical protein